jgi:hypothetical protein
MMKGRSPVSSLRLKEKPLRRVVIYCVKNPISQKGGLGMKRLMIVLGIVLMGVVFCTAPCYAVCPYFPGNSYPIVYKYMVGKKTVQEKWECVIDIQYSNSNGVCFYNFVDASNARQICISGDFKIEYPVEPW